MNIGPTWTVERIKTLKSYVTDGLSATEIGSEMGLSRNAVIGKLHRMGVSLKREPTNPMIAARRASGARAHPKPKRIRMYRGPWPTPAREIEIVPDTLAVINALPDTSEFACSIADLGTGMCRYILGEATAEAQYCGTACVGSWCARHHRIVWSKWGRG